MVLLIFLMVAVVTDLTQTRISNRLIAVGLLCGLVCRIYGEGWTSIQIYMMNIFIPVILLFLLFYMRALGAGDIKLFSVVGAFVSTKQLMEIVMIAFFLAAFVGGVKLIYKYLVVRLSDGKQTQIHFSPSILFAYLISIWRCING